MAFRDDKFYNARILNPKHIITNIKSVLINVNTKKCTFYAHFHLLTQNPVIKKRLPLRATVSCTARVRLAHHAAHITSNIMILKDKKYTKKENTLHYTRQ
jgi:hypothetical protein